MQIVLAKVEEAQEIVRVGRQDVGESHKFKTVRRPVALMWLNEGTKRDVIKAKSFAKTEGYSVLCYDSMEDPLGAARQDIMSI